MISRGPTGIAAAAIYLAAKRRKKDRTQSEVAQVAGVTEVTIRNRYKELCEHLGFDAQDPTKNL
jgi:transcription initiation factor TFIIB